MRLTELITVTLLLANKELFKNYAARLPLFTEFLHVIFRMKNRKTDFDFGPNFSGFFVRLLLTNERASDGNISGAYTSNTRGSKEDLESVFKKIPYEHTSDLHCKRLLKINKLPLSSLPKFFKIIFSKVVRSGS